MTYTVASINDVPSNATYGLQPPPDAKVLELIGSDGSILHVIAPDDSFLAKLVVGQSIEIWPPR